MSCFSTSLLIAGSLQATRRLGNGHQRPMGNWQLATLPIDLPSASQQDLLTCRKCIQLALRFSPALLACFRTRALPHSICFLPLASAYSKWASSALPSPGSPSWALGVIQKPVQVAVALDLGCGCGYLGRGQGLLLLVSRSRNKPYPYYTSYFCLYLIT